MSFGRLAAVLLVLLGLAGGVAGCNTTEGFGKDLQNLGKGIEEESQE